MIGKTTIAKTVLAWALQCAAAFAGWAQPAASNAQSIAAEIRAKRYDRALELASHALETAPNDVQVLTLEAIAWKELGQDRKALAAFQSALELSPEYLAALEGAAQLEQGLDPQAGSNGDIFEAPAMGTEGSKKSNGFRNPGYAQTDLNLAKATHIAERFALQLRFEFYNAFNRVNLNGADANFNSSTFGRSTGQGLPRNIQIGANLTF